MAKLKDVEIDQATLIRYLDTKSDFHFELKILKMMRDLGLWCEHGGHYVDPVTKKSREFDIRCRAQAGPFGVQLAVECKNLQKNFPLLVSAVQRHPEESYHNWVLVADREPDLFGSFNNISIPKPLETRAEVQRFSGPRSIYLPGQPVGKSTTQVGISAVRGDDLIHGDGEVYEKWGQCLSSLEDMLGEMEDMRDLSGESPMVLATALPILVVPNGTLWQTVYDDGGTRIGDPCPLERTSVYVGKDYSLGPLHKKRFNVSHVEIMTETGLGTFIRQSLVSAAAMSSTLFANVDLARLTADLARLRF